MKKLFFIAVMASVAFASCTKNEPASSINENQAITFATPVVSNLTKAATFFGETVFPTSQTFKVFGYYHESNFAGTGTVYMNDVTVSYNKDLGTDADAGSGAWSVAGYYWPKNGKLTFDAYAPSTISMTSTVAGGLAITTEYEVKNTVADQVDILFSDRAYDKTASTGNIATYDGVDIQFNHALAVVQVKVAAANTAACNNVKITKISAKSVSNKGKFAQNYTNGKTGSTTPSWTVTSNSSNEYVFGSSETLLTSTTLDIYGDYHILLPQTFAAGGATLVIEYAIKHGTQWLAQKNSYTLYNGGQYYSDNSTTPVKIQGWEMGKRYTYNFKIGLDQVYFAPQVDEWVDVDSTIPTI